MIDESSSQPKDWQIQQSYDDASDPLPTLASVDVVVVGAGAAGVAAATVAAEAGKSVMLVEAYGFAGGAAVAGMSATLCGLYAASDARRPIQVVHGFAERFRAGLVDRRGITPPQKYGKTWTNAHDPLVWRELADDLLEHAGVRVLFHTSVSGVLVSNVDGERHVRGVVVESKAGRSTVRAQRVIDASGDAAVAARAGMHFSVGNDGIVQNPTMIFRLGGVNTDAFWAKYGNDTICSPAFSDEIATFSDGPLDLPRKHIWVFASPRPGELIVNATRLTHASGEPLNVIDPNDYTIAEVSGRRQARRYAQFLIRTQPGCDGSYMVDTGVEAGVRQTRSISGVDTIMNRDVLSSRKRSDGVVRSPWPIELHQGDRPKVHWIMNDWCDVPLGTLIPQQGEGLIVAGRCLSAEHEALASVRVTAQCFELGNAAGITAVISLDNRSALRDVKATEVRRRMAATGSTL